MIIRDRIHRIREKGLETKDYELGIRDKGLEIRILILVFSGMAS